MFIFGNKEILENKKAVVLNSSQSKTPCGGDPWVATTASAIQQLIESGYTIVSSLGLNTWELTVYLNGKFDGNQIIIGLDGNEETSPEIYYRTIKDFGLSNEKTTMIFLESVGKTKSPKSGWVPRDKAAVEQADILVPISINPKGKLRKLIEREFEGKVIDERYIIEYHKPIVSPPRYSVDNLVPPTDDWEYLTHWTRACHGPWPGQSKQSYYDSIINSGNEYPNDAFHTLRRMAEEGLIRGSSKRIRDGFEVVGLTESPPEDVLKSLRWLPKRTGWNFEPYGIAIKKSHAERMGIRKAIYGDSGLHKSLPVENRAYFQSVGGKDTDWTIEREWRAAGDIDLTSVPPGDIIYFVWKKTEVGELREIVSPKTSIISLT